MSIATWEFESPPLHIVNVFFSKNGSAEIAQLVEHNLAKVGVAGPSPVFRSFFFCIYIVNIFFRETTILL